MSVNGCGVFFQIDLIGDGSSSSFVINLAKQPVQFYNSVLPAHGVASRSQSFNISEASTILAIDQVSSTAGAITSFSLNGLVLSVLFTNAVPSTTTQLTGRLLIGSN